MHEDVSKAGVYRERALECRRLALMCPPVSRDQYERLARAYDQLADELEIFKPHGPP
jgi:hypothetical protein